MLVARKDGKLGKLLDDVTIAHGGIIFFLILSMCCCLRKKLRRLTRCPSLPMRLPNQQNNGLLDSSVNFGVFIFKFIQLEYFNIIALLILAL